MAAALRSGAPQLAVVAGGKAVVAQPSSARARGPAFAARFGRGQWPAAAMLAASLVLGVMLGSTGTLDATMQEVAQVAGFGSAASDSSQLALSDDIYGQMDEDML